MMSKDVAVAEALSAAERGGVSGDRFRAASIRLAPYFAMRLRYSE